jgi:hypothetical protein
MRQKLYVGVKREETHNDVDGLSLGVHDEGNNETCKENMISKRG